MGTRLEVLAKLDAHVEKRCVELAVNISAELIATTPVDTGWARANWVPSLTVPYGGRSLAGSGSALDVIAQESGLSEVLAFKLADGAIFVSNHVPYIRRLNAGHSRQAPAGFVEAAIAKTLVTMGGAT